MSFMGVVGIVAQAGQAASAPTGVSIGTTSSGNYNNAVIAEEQGSCGSHDYFDLSGGTLSGTITVGGGSGILAGYSGCDSQAITYFKGYIRATGATSYAWDMDWGGDGSAPTLSNGCSASFSGSASTDQDETSGHIGKILVFTFGGGRGGLTGPAAGEEILLLISADATNSTGTTSASDVDITYTFGN